MAQNTHSSQRWLDTLRDASGALCREFWTGPPPFAGTPGVLPDGTMTSLPLLNLSTSTKQAVLDYLDNTWCLAETLFSSLRDEEVYKRPPDHGLRHPMIFYYGHPAAFWVNKLQVAGLLDGPVNSYYEDIFETGVDEMSWDDLAKNDMEWPPLREVHDYRKQVYNLVRQIMLDNEDVGTVPISWNTSTWVIPMCLEHDRIHLETSSVLIRELPLSLLRRPPQWPDNAYDSSSDALKKNPVSEFISVPADDVTIGKPLSFPSYGWDNEYGQRQFHVQSFAASNMLTSNGLFLEFVKDNGYHKHEFWTANGWKWRSFRNAKWPGFWVPDGPAGLHKYKLRQIFEEVDLPLNLPAIVNMHEAQAYCKWLSLKHRSSNDRPFRLLTEVEHHRLRETGRLQNDDVMELSGFQMRKIKNLNMAYGSEGPVDAFPQGTLGFFDTVGNVWQWCEDLFSALPGGHGIHPLYDDFSTPCYDGQHNIIMGGSFMSTGDEASKFARFHFRPHFFQHAGFRVVKSSFKAQHTHIDSPPPHVGDWNPSSAQNTPQKSDQLTSAALTYYRSADTTQKHMAVPLEMGSFPKLYVDSVMDKLDGFAPAFEDVLEIGCSVGGVSFELARHFENVTGLDISPDKLKIAAEIQQKGVKELLMKTIGVHKDMVSVSSDVPQKIRAKVKFRQMDPCALQPDLGCYGCVLLTNVLERIPSPMAPLARMGGPRGLVKPGGALVIACSGDWSEKFSEKKLWLEGISDASGSQVDLISSLCRTLGENFTFVHDCYVPIVTPITTRKFEVKMVNVSVWLHNLGA